eukprot:11154677-Lingulodinium_polyedra.AAC.1
MWWGGGATEISPTAVPRSGSPSTRVTRVGVPARLTSPYGFERLFRSPANRAQPSSCVLAHQPVRWPE